MKINVEPTLCMAFRMCMEEAPEIFELDPETGQARVRHEVLTAELEAKARSAASLCPQQALFIEY